VNVQRGERFVNSSNDDNFVPVAWFISDLPQGSGRPCVTARGEGWQERRGAANPNARLSDAAVAEIRALRATGTATLGEIAAKYGIGPSQVGRIVRGESRLVAGLAAKTIEERFWEKVQKSDGCWLWTAATAPHGYGRFWVPAGSLVLAHSFAWALVNGPVPDGMEVCHNCPGGDNPLCVRPEHCFLGTHADNMRDMAEKGRSKRGSEHANSKLTESDVLVIRSRYAAGGATFASLACEYGVSPTAIGDIIEGRRWAWLV
jgi:hypothetical protein